MNYQETNIFKYWKSFSQNGGNTVVSGKIFKLYKKLVADLKNTDSDYYFDFKRAKHPIDFIEKFCHPSKGKQANKPLKLMLWQKAMLEAIFGFVDIEGNRKYRRVFLLIGRKNGKSAIASAIGLYMMVADLENGSQILATAAKKDQAKIIWQEAKLMVKKSPTLRKMIKTRVADMVAEFNDAEFKPLASDSDSLDGLNAHCSLMDEIHSWKGRGGRPLYDVIVDSMTAREQPLILITTTSGTTREDIFDELREEMGDIIDGWDNAEGYQDERTIPFMYELDKPEEWREEKMWIKANPGIGVIKNQQSLKEKVDLAKQNPRMVRNMLCKEFNINESDTDAWLSFNDFNNESTFDVLELKPRYFIGGVDLSATTDLTCATAIFGVEDEPNKLYVMQQYFMPSDLFEERMKDDRVPYDKWKEQGIIILSGGSKVDYKDITNWYLKLQMEYDTYPFKIGYDAWSSGYLIDELKNTFGPSVPEAIHQGFKSLSAPMKALGADLMSGNINYNNNGLLKWCISNTRVKVDENANIKPVKGNNPRKRIDGLASLLDAYATYERYMEEYRGLI
ncbi:terminase TerL endonuclease subunit [Enterococcus faecalis]|uniref:terminase TerL endonuclease subunit n=1 Tax=Enterococcus faecalis TaxID=1351 RepID=UPI001A9751C1